MNFFDYNEDDDVEDIEIVIGDDSNLEFSDVEDFATDLKPDLNQKKKNIVIPTAKKKSSDENDKKNNKK